MTQAAWLLGRGITPLQPGLGAGPLAFERCTPVGWLFSADFVNRATCFLIEENWIATAAHVLPNARIAAAHVVAFNYARGGDPRDRDAYALCPDDRGYFGINRDAQGLDVALVRVCHRPARAGPGVAWGTVAIAAPQEALPASEIVLVQHPNVHDVKCYSTGKIETPKEGFVGHGAASDYGTSGAPLLDTDGHWLGIHKGSSSGIQRATSAVAVFDWLRSQFAKLPPELQGIL
ncbi:MAG: serine protease [Usitatibacter sp.]